MEKYLIAGLGNPGPEYHETRHNIGWMVVDAFAQNQDASFQDKRFGFVAETSVKGRKLFLLKPTTFMNLWQCSKILAGEREHPDGKPSRYR